MPDGYLISVGVKADFSDLKAATAQGADAVQQMASEIAGALDDANTAAEASGASFAEMANAYSQVEAQGLQTVQTLNALTAAAAQESAAVSQAAADNIAASSDTTDSMSAQALASGQLQAAYEAMAAAALQAADSQNRVRSVLQQYREGALSAALATQLLSTELQENAAATAGLNAIKAEAIAAESALTEAKLRATGVSEEQAAATVGVAVAESEEAVAATEAAAATGTLTNRLYAAQGAARLLEGGLPLRAFERLISMSSLLGSALEFAFPLIGAVALVEIVGRGIEKLHDFVQAANEATDRIKRDWLEANDSIMRSNDSLQASTDREIESANKLLGRKGGNALTEAFDDARQSADKLGESIDSDLKKFDELIKKKADTVGFWGGVVSGKAPTSDSEKLLAGEESKIRSTSEEYGGVVDRAGESGNSANLAQAQQARIVALQKTYASATADIQSRLQQLVDAQSAYEASGKTFGRDQTANINLLAGALRNLDEQQRTIGLTYANGLAKQDQLQAKDVNAAQSAAKKAAAEAKRAAQEQFNAWKEEAKNEAAVSADALAANIGYWTQKVIDTKSGSQLHVDALKEYNAAIRAMELDTRKSEEELEKSSGKRTSETVDDHQAELLKENDKALKDSASQTAVWARAVDESTVIQEHNADALENAEIQADKATGKISALTAAQREAALHVKEHSEQLKLLEDRLAAINDPKNPLGLSAEEKKTQGQQTQNQISQTNGSFKIQGVQDAAAQAKDFEQPWVTAFNSIEKSWTSTMDAVLKGQISISRGAQRMASQALLDVINSLVKQGAEHAKQYAIDNVLHLQSVTQKKAVDTAADTTKLAQHTATTSAITAIDTSANATTLAAGISTNLALAASYAAVAAVGAFASTAEIPIVGPLLAPGVAGATYGAAMGFASLASASGGWDRVPSDTLAMIHKDEMVMSAPLANNIRNMTSTGGTTIHNGGNTFNGMSDAKTFQKMLSKHERSVASTTKKAMRNGRF